MMRVSTKGEYGVRVMVDLARHYRAGPLSLSEVSHRQNLPLPYLEQLIGHLRKADLVVSTRGTHGGYELSRSPEEITMAEVLRCLEGSLAPMKCVPDTNTEAACEFSLLDSCSTKYLWGKVRDSIVQTLTAITLAELAAQPGDRYFLASASLVETTI